MVIQTSSRSLLGGMVRSTVGARGQSDRAANLWKIEKSTGNVVWGVSLGSGEDVRSVSVEPGGDVFCVTGTSLYKTNRSGVEQWSLSHNGDFYRLASDASGNVFVATPTILTKYTNGGSLAWSRTPSLTGSIAALACDVSNVWVTQQTTANGSTNLLYKYDASGTLVGSYFPISITNGTPPPPYTTYGRSARYIHINGNYMALYRLYEDTNVTGSGTIVTRTPYCELYNIVSGTPVLVRGWSYGFMLETSLTASSSGTLSVAGSTNVITPGIVRHETPSWAQSKSVDRVNSHRILCDGTNAYVLWSANGSGQWVEKLSHSSGAKQWGWNPGARVDGLDADASYLYVGGESSSTYASAAT